ncbi:MAG: VOC family protein [Cyanomargarita calcarea GSE-NOS-MK-12-04C]|jgi:PhnB protein|uniref:VOC family protein n=1 Tax=Cyanomargarita calcarea GSE-NOS-MK-12-04C TaxID=2839659 RepID=A0A951QKH0_9CYAN|nr:VOC family protein [Cyanomargarita calcarea GSE-NOS-MK-12-04C]
MQSNTYLNFNGECEAAFKFYEQCLGGKIVAMMTYADMPMVEQTPPEQRDKIMHIHLTVGDMVLMGSDAPPDYFEKPQGFNVNLQFDDVVEAERIFHALAENGTVKMPFQETFWAKRFGMAIDRFGTPWMINCG